MFFFIYLSVYKEKIQNNTTFSSSKIKLGQLEIIRLLIGFKNIYFRPTISFNCLK